MELSDQNVRLIDALQGGLPLTPRPYAAIGEELSLSEQEVIAALRQLLDRGLVKRLGIIVRHRKLGYRANGMAVWDIPDERVADVGRCLSGYPFVTLCYRRPRRLPEWPYNLFTMIHGRDRDVVKEQVDRLARDCGLENAPRDILFSKRCFKQQGARFKCKRQMMTAAAAE